MWDLNIIVAFFVFPPKVRHARRLHLFMKTKLLLNVAVTIIFILVAACASPAKNNSGIVSDNVIGTYEFKDMHRNNVSWKLIFHENGSLQRWANGALQPPGVWKVEDGKIRIDWKNGSRVYGLLTNTGIKPLEHIAKSGEKIAPKNFWKKVQ